MASWVDRWTFEGKGHMKNPIRACVFKPMPKSNEPIEYHLAPSKSHLIRILGLALITGQEIKVSGVNGVGNDVIAMRRCCIQLGLNVIDLDENFDEIGVSNRLSPPSNSHHWILSTEGIKKPHSVLNAENSGTALRLLIGIASSQNFPVMLDGDNSLRSRKSDELLDCLRLGDVNISHGRGSENLPFLIQGPINWNNEFILDVSKSSQYISSLIFSSTGLEDSKLVSFKGQQVSRRHSKLSQELANTFGANCEITSGGLSMEKWDSSDLREYTNPSDLSMLSFALLLSRASGNSVKVSNLPGQEDSLGNEILLELLEKLGFNRDEETFTSNSDSEYLEVDLRDANDLITPICALLALGSGGKITGSSHAAHKESNRLEKTVELLANFGLNCDLTSDGIIVEGNQKLVEPTRIIRTYADHRLAMTAMALATKTGATIETPDLCQVSDYNFRTRLAEHWDSAVSAEVLIDVV